MMDVNAVILSRRQHLIAQESPCPSPLLEIANPQRKQLNRQVRYLDFFGCNKRPQQFKARIQAA